jgi:superfamily I DNA/RNA helicase
VLSRETFLTELTLDPPQATSAEAGSPHLDEDCLVLSTIHSAKGREWDAVFVLNVTDGCIPSDMAVVARHSTSALMSRGDPVRTAPQPYTCALPSMLRPPLFLPGNALRPRGPLRRTG